MHELTIEGRNSKTNKRILFAYIIIVALLLALGMTSNVVTLVCAILVGLSFLFVDNSTVISAMLLFYPFYCIFKFNGNGVSYYNLIIAFAIVGLALNKGNNRKKTLSIFINGKIKKSLGILLIFCTYILVSSSVMTGTIPFIQIIIDFVILFIFVIFAINQSETINIEQLATWFAIGVIIAGLVGGEFIPVRNLTAYISPRGYRIGGVRLIRLQGLTVNPNYYSFDINLAIAGLISTSSLLNRRIKRTEIIYIVVLIILGIMSLSKSFLAGLGVTLLILLFVLRGNRKFTYFVLIGCLAICVGLYASFQNDSYLNAIITRFASSADSADALTSSRTDIWMTYIRFLFSHPAEFVIGSGINAEMLNMVSASHASHNFYIECLYHLGIIGTIIIFRLFISFRKKHEKYIRIAYLPLGVFLIRAFAINILLREALPIWLMFVILFLNYEYNTKAKYD